MNLILMSCPSAPSLLVHEKKFLDLSSSSFLCLLNSVTTMKFQGGDKVEVCKEEEGFLGSYYAATAIKNLVEEEDMSKHLIKTHHKPSAKTHRWSTLLNDLNLRTHPAPKPLTRPLKPSPPLLLIFFFFFKPNPFLVNGATIS